MIGLFNEPEKDNGKKTTKNGEGYLNLPKQQGYIENLLWRDKNSKNDTIQINYTKPKNGYIQNLMKNNIPGWKDIDSSKIERIIQPDKTKVHTNNFYINEEADFDYRPFKKESVPYLLAEGMGITGSIRLSGLIARKGNELHIIANSRNRPEYKMDGDVQVMVDGKLDSTTRLIQPKEGSFYRTGGPKPLGNAVVKLPKKGKIEVWVNGSGYYKDDTGRAAKNVSEKVYDLNRK